MIDEKEKVRERIHGLADHPGLAIRRRSTCHACLRTITGGKVADNFAVGVFSGDEPALETKPVIAVLRHQTLSAIPPQDQDRRPDNRWGMGLIQPEAALKELPK